MTEPLWSPYATTETRQRRLLGCLAPAIGGVLVGILLALVALVILAPQPRVARQPGAAPAHATLTLDDAFLSQLSGDALRGAALPFTLSNVRVAIHPDNQIALVADAITGPLNRQLAMTGTLVADSGQLHIHVTQASVGGLTLPAALDTVLGSALNARLATLNDQFQVGGTRYAITSVTTQEGQLTLGLAPS